MVREVNTFDRPENPRIPPLTRWARQTGMLNQKSNFVVIATAYHEALPNRNYEITPALWHDFNRSACYAASATLLPDGK